MHSDLNTKGSSGEPAYDLRLNKPNMREYLSSLFDDLLFLTEKEFDEAIVGIAHRIGMNPVVAYDTTKIIDILCERDGMERDEAAEYFEFNILGAYVGENTPMFVDLVDDLFF